MNTQANQMCQTHTNNFHLEVQNIQCFLLYFFHLRYVLEVALYYWHNSTSVSIETPVDGCVLIHLTSALLIKS